MTHPAASDEDDLLFSPSKKVVQFNMRPMPPTPSRSSGLAAKGILITSNKDGGGGKTPNKSLNFNTPTKVPLKEANSFSIPSPRDFQPDLYSSSQDELTALLQQAHARGVQEAPMTKVFLKLETLKKMK